MTIFYMSYIKEKKNKQDLLLVLSGFIPEVRSETSIAFHANESIYNLYLPHFDRFDILI